MAKAGSIRGLQVFIGDIRACQNKEQETKRVDKELAKIRAKFGDEKKTLTGVLGLSAARAFLCQARACNVIAVGLTVGCGSAVQLMTGRSMFGSFFTSICWGTMLSSGTSKRATSYQARSKMESSLTVLQLCLCCWPFLTCCLVQVLRKAGWIYGMFYTHE